MIPTDPAEHVIPALQHSPAVLFLHGNAATRAFSSRIQSIKAFSSRLGANVLIIDYRGYGDSSGTPSEAGLVTDAKAAFDWLVSHGNKAEDILIVGHSLGTGVSGQLAVQFGKEGVECKGFVLLSPFTSIVRLLNDYNMFGIIPLTRPISLIPGAAELLERVVVHRFDTLQAVPNITVPVLIAHAENDWDISDAHADILFQAFLDPILTTVESPQNSLPVSPESWHELTEQHARRKEVLDKVVRTTRIPKFGRVEEFDDGKRKVVLVKTLAGGHDHLGKQEGLVDIIGKTFGFR
jgi:abhydrolase domain-containing protein 12